MRVIATRPIEYNTDWIQTLCRLGYDTLVLPLLDIQPVGENRIQHIKERILDLDHYQKIIFISQNAVRYGLDWIEDYWPQIPDGIMWIAIGGKTQACMRDRLNLTGDKALSPRVMNSEGVLALEALRNIEHEKILIFRGVGGRETLAVELQARGATVEYCELYQRCAPCNLGKNILSINITAHDVLPVFSGESLLNFCEAAQALQYETLKIVVPGERVAEIARNKGFEYIVVAENASEAAMLSAIGSIEP